MFSAFADCTVPVGGGIGDGTYDPHFTVGDQVNVHVGTDPLATYTVTVVMPKQTISFIGQPDQNGQAEIQFTILKEYGVGASIVVFTATKAGCNDGGPNHTDFRIVHHH